jgi:hypothetical protein
MRMKKHPSNQSLIIFFTNVTDKLEDWISLTRKISMMILKRIAAS